VKAASTRHRPELSVVAATTARLQWILAPRLPEPEDVAPTERDVPLEKSGVEPSRLMTSGVQ